jgi:hypothetical protein
MKRVFLLIGLIVMYLTIAEIALEFRDFVRGYSSLIFDLSKQVLTGGNKVAESVNDRWRNSGNLQFPFRSQYILPPKAPNVKRIWILSSSYAEDIYLPVDAIWPNVLVSLLNRIKPGTYELLNAAKAGMDTLDGLEKLKKYYSIYKPDLVIAYNMSNEIIKMSRSLFVPARGFTSTGIEKKQWSDMIVENSTIYDKTVRLVRTRLVGEKILADSLGERNTRPFVLSQEKLKEFCRMHGILLVLCTFATEVTEHDNPDKVAESIRFLFAYNPYLSAKGWIRTVNDLNEKIRTVHEEAGTIIADLAKNLSGQPLLFRDYIHFTREGHKAVAKELVSIILEHNN